MTTSFDLDRLRRDTPGCAGIAWFHGAPLQLVAASGEPAAAGWSSWEVVARVAPALLRDGPVASPEVLMRLSAAVVLISERPAGVVAVVIQAPGASIGVALVQARIAAAQVGG